MTSIKTPLKPKSVPEEMSRKRPVITEKIQLGMISSNMLIINANGKINTGFIKKNSKAKGAVCKEKKRISNK